jgi:drug/metabolite transporter (DMT)-like permease
LIIAPDAAAKPAITVSRHKRHGLMHLAMLGVVFCWAANLVAIKEALQGFSPMALAQVRAIFTALLFGFLFLVFRRRSSLRPRGRQWLYFAIMAFCGVTMGQILFIRAMSLTSVPHAALIVAVEPVMVLILSVLMRFEPLTLLKSLGMIISFSGVVVLTYARAAHGNHAYWLGDVILVAQVLVFSCFIILMKGVADQYDALTLNAMVFGLGALMMLPFGARAAWQVSWSRVPLRSVLGLGFMVVFASVVAYLLFAFALTGLTASRVAAFNYIEPIIATALGIWLLADKVSLQGLLGGALILLGVYFTERERDENGDAKSPAIPEASLSRKG